MEHWSEAVRRQDGVLARWQAVDGGLSIAQWDWRLSSGRWQSLLPGVAVTHTGAPTRRQLAWAGCLHCGPGAVLSGDAALRLRGFKGALGMDIEVVVPPGRRVRVGALPGHAMVIAHRSLVVPRRRTVLQGLPTVDAHLAVLHAAAWAVDDRAAEWRVAAAVQQGLTAAKNVREALMGMPRLRRRALLRLVLDDVELGAHAASELAYLRFCRAHGVPLPDELQVRVRAGGTHYLDARYARQRVTLELDGAHHREAEQWEADALRTLRVTVALPGERVVRLTPANLRHDGPEVARLLRALLA